MSFLIGSENSDLAKLFIRLYEKYLRTERIHFRKNHDNEMSYFLPVKWLCFFHQKVCTKKQKK